MNMSTEEIFKKLSDKITLIYDLEFAKEFTEIFEDLVSHMKDKSKRHWKQAAIVRERDEERRARALAEYDADYLAKELDEERCARAQAEDDV